jgi:hypothetical protein
MSLPLGTMLYADLASVDGGVMKRETLERIVDSVEAISAILQKRNDSTNGHGRRAGSSPAARTAASESRTGR